MKNNNIKISILTVLFACFLVFPTIFLIPNKKANAEVTYRFSSQVFSFSVLPFYYETDRNNKISSISSGSFITSLSLNFNLIANGGGVGDGYMSLNTYTTLEDIREKSLTDLHVSSLEYNDDFYFLGASSPYNNGATYLGYNNIYNNESLSSFNRISNTSSLATNRWHTLFYTNGEHEPTLIIFCYYCQNGFNGNVVSYSTGNRVVKEWSRNYYNLFNFITFYDSNGFYCTFQFLVSVISQVDYVSNFSPLFLLDNRSFSIYGNLNNNDFYNLGYNDGYQQGFNTALDDVNTSIYYNNGFSDGEAFGYNKGYTAGLNDSNQYTFGNLLFSVLDTPVKILASLLDFDILGMNLLDLFYGLITCSLVLFIVRNLISRS